MRVWTEIGRLRHTAFFIMYADGIGAALFGSEFIIEAIYGDLLQPASKSFGVFEFCDGFYRIGYPKALIMISNGSVFGLEAFCGKHIVRS